jgi:1-acyl-sn-glycerol-3-phosphate acyltransferase
MARGHTFLLAVAYAIWMFTAGLLLAQKWREWDSGADTTRIGLTIACNCALTVGLHILLMSRLFALAGSAVWSRLRVAGFVSIAGLLGGLLGLIAHREQVFGLPLLGENVGNPIWIWLQVASGIGVALGTLLIPRPAKGKERFFLFDRSHSASWDARRALATGFGQAAVVTLAAGWVGNLFGSGHGETRGLLLFAAGYLMGALLPIVQKYPMRQFGLLPWAAIFSCILLGIHWLAPGQEWPVYLLGGVLGLTHIPPRNFLLVAAPAFQRGRAMSLMVLSQAIGVLLGATLLKFAAPVVWFVATLGLTALAIRFLFREMFEQLAEVILAPFYRIKGYGPGVDLWPLRGPVVVLANHSAWFDPIWLGKVIPLRMRPMMTARFYDLPGVRWLMVNVVHTIRVAESGFRREMPEVQTAIAGLAKGDTILIFPEGWLRRKEDHSLRRFGQGVYQMLKAHPQTPVVVCWIEGGWKSFASYFNGPPTKNKRMDFWRSIRIGISAPQVLSPELLADHKATRRHLMQACLQARTILGLPALPPPSFVTCGVEEEEKEEESQLQKS